MSSGTAPAKPAYFQLLNQLRAVAALLVVWAHFIGQWLERRGLDWGPETAMVRFVTGPFNIIQHFGFLGVAIFFLISGFIVTRAASLENLRTFVVRRLLRIYPPLIAAVLLAVVMLLIGVRYGLDSGIDPATADQITWATLLTSFTLVTYVSVPQVIFLAVAWTLAIEMIFYALLAAVGPILRARRLPDALATVVMIGAVVVVTALGRSLGDEFFLFSVSMSYIPLLLLGHVLYLVTQRDLNVLVGLALAATSWMTFVWALERTQPHFLTPAQSYGSSMTIAIALVTIAVLAEGRLRPSRALGVVATRSYSLYLVHGPVGLLLLDLVARTGTAYRWALVVALAGAAVTTEAMYRGLERPSIALARHLTRASRATSKEHNRDTSTLTSPPPTEPFDTADAREQACSVIETSRDSEHG